MGYKKKKKRKKFDFLLVHQLFKRIQIAAISINFYYFNVFVCFFCVFGSVGGSKLVVRCQRNVSTEQRACHCVSTPIWSYSNPVYLGYTHFLFFFCVYPVIHMVSVHNAASERFPTQLTITQNTGHTSAHMHTRTKTITA